MLSPRTISVLVVACLLGSVVWASPVSIPQLKETYGPVQGELVLGEYTFLVFETVKVKVHHQTGTMNLIPIQKSPLPANARQLHTRSGWLELKRKIARLPAHEQVRYWKLHQVRHPEQDVTAELETALDKMEAIRQRAVVERETSVQSEQQTSNRYYRRNNTWFLPYFPSYTYRDNYRYRRAIRKDTQIELERIRRKPRPVENWNTAMNIADRARSDALAKVRSNR